MHHAPPPPTVFRRLEPSELAEQMTDIWRLATTDDQRWALERLAESVERFAEDIAGMGTHL